MIEKQTRKPIKHLHMDNLLLFYFNDFNALCKLEGIVRHHIVPHIPQQNCVAERMNMNIMKEVKCMLSHVGLSKSFWAEATCITCFLINRSPSVVIDKKSPLEVWSNTHANYSDLKTFECLACTHVDNG